MGTHDLDNLFLFNVTLNGVLLEQELKFCLRQQDFCNLIQLCLRETNNGLIDISDKERGLNKATDGVCTIIGKIIHLLIQADRKYVASALAVGKSPNGLQNGKKIDLELFDASALSSHLSKSLNILLPLLPFEIKICGADSPLGINNDTHEEAIFPIPWFGP